MITFIPLPRDEVISYLGRSWPARPGATVERVLSVPDATDGALAVRPDGDRPGTTWWVVDGLIVPQDAGPPPLLPGCPLETLPAPAAGSPPFTPVPDAP